MFQACGIKTRFFYFSQHKTHWNEVTDSDSSEDLVNGGIGRQGTVKDVKLSLQPLWYIITTTTRVNHSAHHLDINQCRKLSRLLQVIEAIHLHHLPSYLIGHLQCVKEIDWTV